LQRARIVPGTDGPADKRAAGRHRLQVLVCQLNAGQGGGVTGNGVRSCMFFHKLSTAETLPGVTIQYSSQIDQHLLQRAIALAVFVGRDV